jgi:hypothetical protein
VNEMKPITEQERMIASLWGLELDGATGQDWKVIPMVDWNEALNALRDGIASHDLGMAEAAMKTALRLLNPCPF